MSDREEDFGFEVDPEKKSQPFDADEEFSIDPSEEEEDFSLGVAGEDEGGFDLEPEENPGFDQPGLEEESQDLFTVADDEPVTVIDEDAAHDEVFVEDLDSEEPPAQKSSPMRLLLLVGLLVVIGAAAFFFLGMPEGPTESQPVPVATKKQPIAIPAQPVVKPIAKAEPAAPVKVEAPAVPPAEDKAQPVAAEKVTSEPVKSAEPAPVAERPAITVKPAEKAVAVPSAAKVAPNYQVQAGAFLLSGNLKKAEKQVRGLGFDPEITEARKKMPMVRLQFGKFSREEGPAKLAELKKKVADAFIVYEGDVAIIYAGSFLSLDKARRHADLLWEKGIRVEEVETEVEVPMHRLMFGGFADKKSASAAADKARAAGLEAQVVQYRGN